MSVQRKTESKPTRPIHLHPEVHGALVVAARWRNKKIGAAADEAIRLWIGRDQFPLALKTAREIKQKMAPRPSVPEKDQA